MGFIGQLSVFEILAKGHGVPTLLSAFEILAQVALALRVVEERGLPPLHNVVFMGMGEPLNNMANVREAVNVITDDNCFRFAKGCVTRAP
ncbi:hypothetical protein T484DRAFT_1775887 [Baffinella frigidus]|nr:hypothetical protein T484DRAFT_1775887 [Cryptophyta sp. CCMP2293]